MKKFLLLFLSSLLILNCSFGQPGTWTWISGSSAYSAPAVYGVQGVPSVNNCPYSGYEHSEWKDKQGNFWLYGGAYPSYEELWKFNPLTLEWTWVKGDSIQLAQALYGTKGVPGHFNTPGTAGWGAPTWVDTSGALWLLGGYPALDLWRYDIGTNDWTWVSGSHVTQAGNHGTLGMPSDSSFPGNRQECASAWVDSVNNLWFFGGYGYDDSSKYGSLNDVWKYNISTNQWTWMKGSAYVNAPVVYGTKGVSNATNDPGARWTYSRWKDKQGNFWIFGGLGYTAQEGLNDMWRYNPAIDEWTWMGGTTVGGDSGVYGPLCQYDSSYWPAARFENRATVTDNQGRFWLCGGATVDSGHHCNDLWLFDPGLNQWKLLKGGGQIYGNFGTKGVSSPFIIPPAANGANAWWGNDNKFYMFSPKYYNCLWVYDPDTNCLSASVIPLAGFQSDKTSICAYDCTNFKNLSTNSTSWQWSFPGGIPASSSDQNPQVCYLTSGVYNVTIIATNSSGNTDTLTINNYITVNVAPPVPVITQVHNDTLFCSTDSSYKSYQWYSDTALIPTATDTFLVITKSGNYNVQVAGTDGCKIAVGINIIAGLQNYMSGHVILFSPNPVKDKVQLAIGNWQNDRGIGIYIYDVLGQICKQPEIVNGGSEEVDVSMLSAGIYFVRLIGEKERWTGKFVKE